MQVARAMRTVTDRRLLGRVLAACFIVASCSGGADTAVSVTTNAPGTTIAITDVIELANMTIHVDPNVLDLDQTRALVDFAPKLLAEMPIRDRIDVVLYGSDDESIEWAVSKTKQLDCLYSESRDLYLYGGRAAPCGLVMRVDGMRADCFGTAAPCKNTLTVLAHEYFHIVTDEMLEPCVCEPLIYGNKIPNWYAEGIADYVGYRSVFSSDDQWLPKALRLTMSRATHPAVDVGIAELEALWSKGPAEDWFGLLYERSFFVVSFLVDRYGEGAVLETFFDQVASTGRFTSGFEATFGRTEAELTEEFRAWMADL